MNHKTLVVKQDIHVPLSNVMVMSNLPLPSVELIVTLPLVRPRVWANTLEDCKKVLVPSTVNS